jgi:hypothetical protein
MFSSMNFWPETWQRKGFDVFKQEDDQSRKMLKYIVIHSAENERGKISSIILLTDLALKFPPIIIIIIIIIINLKLYFVLLFAIAVPSRCSCKILL